MANSAKVDDRGFPTLYSAMGELGLTLVSPSFGKLNKNTKYTLEIGCNKKMGLMINGTSNGTTMHNHDGNGNCKLEVTTGSGPSLTVFGNQDNGRNYTGLIAYKVV